MSELNRCLILALALSKIRKEPNYAILCESYGFKAVDHKFSTVAATTDLEQLEHSLIERIYNACEKRLDIKGKDKEDV